MAEHSQPISQLPSIDLGANVRLPNTCMKQTARSLISCLNIHSMHRSMVFSDKRIQQLRLVSPDVSDVDRTSFMIRYDLLSLVILERLCFGNLIPKF